MHQDVIVIGGSFAGLSAALQIARAKRRVLVIDSGEPRNRFSDSAHGFFAQDGRAPSQVLASARAQLLGYPEVEIVDGMAEQAERRGDGFSVRLADGRSFDALRLILATGVRDELPPIPGLRERWGRTVLHCPYCHAYELPGDRLGVLAASAGAPEQARLIADWGDVTLFAQAIALDDNEAGKFLARGGRIEEAKLVSVGGDQPERVTVTLADGRSVELDALFISPELRQASGLAEQLGCRMFDGPHGPLVFANDDKETSIPGVYAAGDMARIGHNATLASADGVVAGMAAHQSLV